MYTRTEVTRLLQELRDRLEAPGAAAAPAEAPMPMKIKLGDQFVRKHAPNYHEGAMTVEQLLGDRCMMRFHSGKSVVVENALLLDQRKYEKLERR